MRSGPCNAGSNEQPRLQPRYYSVVTRVVYLLLVDVVVDMVDAAVAVVCDAAGCDDDCGDGDDDDVRYCLCRCYSALRSDCYSTLCYSRCSWAMKSQAGCIRVCTRV